MNSYQLIGVILFLFLNSLPLAAQYSVQHQNAEFVVERALSTEEGMPANGINKILQDSRGYIWIATYNGIVRYDGKNIRVYDSSNVEELGSNRSLTLLEDSNGCIWSGMEYNYLLRICGESKTVYYLDESIHGFNNHVSTLAEDSEGKIWVGTSRGMVIYEDGEFLKLDHLPSQVARQIKFEGDRVYVLFHRTIYELQLDGSVDGIPVESNFEGEIKIGDLTIDDLYHEGMLMVDFHIIGNGFQILTHTGLVQVENDDYNILFTREDLKQELLHGMKVSDDGYLVYGTDGLVEVTGAGSGVLNVVSYNNRSGRSIIKDHEGSIWYGTNTRGIAQIVATPVYQGDTFERLRDRATMAVLEDRDKNLWVGTNCDGLYRFNDDNVVRFDADNGIDNICIWSLMEQNNGTIWVGTWGGGVYQKPVNSNEFTRFGSGLMEGVNEVLSIYEDRDGNIWFGSYYDGILKYDGEIFHRIEARGGGEILGVRYFYETEDRFWIASDRGVGLIVNDEVHLQDSLNILNSRNFRTITEDTEGRLWFGSYGGGVLIYEDDKEPMKLDESHGLFENSISHLRFDQNDNLWLGGNRGVFFIEESQIRDFLSGELDEVRVSRIGTDEGMPISETTGGFMPSNLLTDDGILYVPTVQGLAKIHSSNINLNLISPKVILESVHVDGAVSHGSDLNDLAYDTQRLVFNFSALSFKNPDYVKFKYKMEGVDEEWQEAGNLREAVYTTLQPGSYTFSVTGSNNDGFWADESASLSFTIVPPFWQTTWFYLLVIFVLTASIIGLIRYRTGKIRENELKLKRVVEDQTEELRIEKSELESLNRKLKDSNYEIEQNKKVIEKQAEELQRQSEMKSHFFTNISHEFRTPLTLIKGISGQLLKGKYGELNSESIKDLRILSYSAEKIERQVEQLLEVSMLEEADKVELDKTTYNIFDQIDLISNSLKSWADRNQIDLTVELPDTKLLIRADQSKVESVLLNLLSNAIRNTREEGGWIKIRAKEINLSDAPGVSIIVEDSGPAISEENQPYIFDRFYQLKNNSDMNIGLGLSLSKEWINLHGGKISYEKTATGENRFSIVVPIGNTSEETEAEKVIIHDERVYDHEVPLSENQPKAKTNKTTNTETVLIVEDNFTLRLHLKKVLGNTYNVIEATNG